MTRADTAKLEQITVSVDTATNLLGVIQERLDEELPPGAAQYLALVDGAAAVLAAGAAGLPQKPQRSRQREQRARAAHIAQGSQRRGGLCISLCR